MARDKKERTLRAKLSDAERAEFAKQLEHFYEVSYADLRKVLTFSFLKGVATGLGVFIGGTLMAALLLWILSQFNGLPFVSNISRAAEHSIKQGRSASEP